MAAVYQEGFSHENGQRPISPLYFLQVESKHSDCFIACKFHLVREY